MQQESTTSDLNTKFQEAKTVKLADLENLKKTEPLWTIVCVEEHNGEPQILLGVEDKPESRFWFRYDGSSREVLETYIKWREEANALYANKARSASDMDYLRTVTISMGIIVDLFKWFGDDAGKQIGKSLTEGVVAALGTKWYVDDHPDVLNNPKILETCSNEIIPYTELVIKYMTRLHELLNNYKQVVTAPDATK